MNEKQIMKSDDWINTLFLNKENWTIMIIAHTTWVMAKINKDWYWYNFTKSEIVEAWINHWWSFLQNLAKTLASADMRNSYIILNSFINYVWDYFDIILKIKQDYENNKF
jgi:hypothetical protein